MLEIDGITFCEVPAGQYVVGVGPDVPRHACEPQATWADYPLTTPEQLVTIDKPFWISRDLVRDSFGLLVVTGHHAAGRAERLGGRLPRWYEWEIAVRGPEPFLYPWGNDFDLAQVRLVTSTYSLLEAQRFPSRIPVDLRARETERAVGILDFGAYENATSPFGLRDLVRAGCEWNDLDGTHVVRSFCDVGAMSYMVPGSRPETYDNESGMTAFSGPIAACYGLEQPRDAPMRLFEMACFRLVLR